MRDNGVDLDVQHVLAHQWSGVKSAHKEHDWDATCAVCCGDVAAVLQVAREALAQQRDWARVIATALEQELTQAQRECAALVEECNRLWRGWQGDRDARDAST